MSFQAPMPFWESNTEQTFSITGGSSGRGLLPALSKLKVSSSESLGFVQVTSTDLIISNGSQSFGFNAPIEFGETITIDTETGIVKNQDNENVYSILNPAPKLFPFPPGDTTIQVNGTGTDLNTFIRCNYALRFEVVH